MTRQPRTLHVVKNLLVDNDEVATENRRRLSHAGVFTINLIAAPGAGKTSLIERAIVSLPELSIGVIEGDIAGRVDTDKVLAAGAARAVQINTGGACHLEADMVAQALPELELETLDLIFVENVGNLICPTAWDLGEHLKICLVSAAEGDDKPLKYPTVFAHSDAVVLNKIDLLELVDFDEATFHSALRALNPNAPLFEVSCRTGEGMDAFAGWLKQLAREKGAEGAVG